MTVGTGKGWRLPSCTLGGEGFADRLSSVYTVIILILAALTVTMAPFLRRPVACFAPAHFTGAHVVFANEACWKAQEYYLPFTKRNIPGDNDGEGSLPMPAVHHYLGLLFLFQALLFFVPCVLWRGLQVLCGVSLNDLTRAGEGALSTDPVVRDRSLGYLVKRVYQRSQGCNYTLVCTYMLVKAIYCLNLMLQLVFIDHFAGGYGHTGYGLRILHKSLRNDGLQAVLDMVTRYIAQGQDTNGTTTLMPYLPTFPRQILCDFMVTRLGNIQRYTVQCQMPLSEFFEMIYAAVWLWLFFVCLVSFWSAFVWFWTALLPPLRDSYVSGRLVAMNKITAEQTATSRPFAQRFLSGDAYFLTRHIASEVSDVSASMVVGGLWDEFGGRGPQPAPGPGYQIGYAPPAQQAAPGPGGQIGYAPPAQQAAPGPGDQIRYAPPAQQAAQPETLPLQPMQGEGMYPKLA